MSAALQCAWCERCDVLDDDGYGRTCTRCRTDDRRRGIEDRLVGSVFETPRGRVLQAELQVGRERTSRYLAAAARTNAAVCLGIVVVTALMLATPALAADGGTTDDMGLFAFVLLAAIIGFLTWFWPRRGNPIAWDPHDEPYGDVAALDGRDPS